MCGSRSALTRHPVLIESTACSATAPSRSCTSRCNRTLLPRRRCRRACVRAATRVCTSRTRSAASDTSTACSTSTCSVGDAEPGYRFAIAASEVTPGRSRRCLVDGHAVLVCNVGGDFYALADTCTHDRGPLGEGRLRGHLLECPRHGSRFDIRDGVPKTPPAMKPVAIYRVRVRDDAVEVLLTA